MNKLYYGAAYYPELWPEETIRQDVEEMKKTGINVVRMGEFSWAKMEPWEDEIDLGFFVDIVGRLNENGIETVFCTPTPTPPVWMSHGHPERMHVDANGNVMSHGARQHCCTNNPYFRERSRIIVEAVVKAVGRLPGVIAWQTDNEFKCHVSSCFCAECRRQWGEWLAKRYKTIDHLNDAWGTQIWSQLYESFDQVPPPLAAPYLHNPSLSTAYRLFSRDKIAEYQLEQVEIIRRYSDAPITHNSHRGFAVDNELIFAPLDFVSFDEYVTCDDWRTMVRSYDFWRNLKPGRPFWVMETSTSHSGCIAGMPKTHRKGFVLAEAVAAYASGAEGFSHWLWRQQRTGCEITHGAVLSAWGKPTVGYESVLQVSEARKRLEPILLNSRPVRAQVGITRSDMARVFIETEPHNGMHFETLIGDWHNLVLSTGVYRDLLPESASLDGYKLLLTPFMPYLSPEFLIRARAFVENGGVWIAGPFIGQRTAVHTVHTDAALGKLEALAGVETVYTYPIGDSGAVGRAFGKRAPLGLWAAVFEPKGAEAVGLIEGGVTPGFAFLTERQVGNGKIVLLGAVPQGDEGDEMLKAMVLHYADQAGVDLRFEHTAGTIVIPRESDTGPVWVAVNMDGAGGTVDLSGPGKDLLNGADVEAGTMKLEPYEYRVLGLG